MRGVLLASVLFWIVGTGWCVAQSPAIPADSMPLTVPEATDPSPGVGTPPLGTAPPELPRFWMRADYLLWKVQSPKLPVLVGTIPVESAEVVQPLSDSLITPVFGGGVGGLSYGMQSGYRLEAGLWLDQEHEWCVEARAFQLQPGHQAVVQQSAATEPLGVVFHDPVANHDVLIMDAVPGLRDGSVSLAASNRLWGAEANVMARLSLPSFPGEVRLLGGFRYLEFDEGLAISTSSESVPGGRLPCG